MDERLSKLRGELDSIDAEMLRLFARRMETAKVIGAVKREAGIPVEDAEREAELIAARLEEAPEEARAGGERLLRLLIEESKAVQRAGLDLYLIGMPDCGKTRLGKKLAARLGRPLVDTDKLIMERTGMSIDEIFSKLGEESFRDMETALLRSIASHGGLIVATGGGMPLRAENVRLMRGSGTVVFLDRALERLLGQSTVNRPLIAGSTREESDEKLTRLYRERREAYQRAAHFSVDPDSPDALDKVGILFRIP